MKRSISTARPARLRARAADAAVLAILIDTDGERIHSV